MKKINKYILPFLALGMSVFSSCSTDYDEPPLYEPSYTPPASAQVIDVKTFKEMFASVADNGSQVISGPYFLKGVVSGNDVSGNIFKQLYVQDYDFADTQKSQKGLYIGVDQNNVANLYGVGQQLYVELDGLSAVRYGGQLQVGNATTNANRIPWEKFLDVVHKNGWANPANMLPKTTTIGALIPSMANTLVKFDNVVFTNAGTGNFIDEKISFTEQAFSDGTGSIIIRTSQYFTALKNKKIPEGKGSLTGIIGLHNSTWQLILRDVSDIGTFTENTDPTPEPTPTTEVYKETFGTAQKVGTSWPLVADYTGYVMKSPIAYSDASGRASIRANAGVSHVWFPASSTEFPNSYLTVKNIDTSKLTNATISFDIAANTYDAGSSINMNVLKVKANDTTLTIPSKEVSNAAGDANKFYSFTIEGFPISNNVTLEFTSDSGNTLGLRLANIVIQEKK